MMDDSRKIEQVRPWGLCASCVRAVVITNDRGSRFVQCALAKSDARYPKYPAVPVRVCAGYLTLPGVG
jgi:hypothetical protein